MVRITPVGLEARQRLLDMRVTLENELASSLASDTQRVAEALDAVSAYLKARLSRYR